MANEITGQFGVPNQYTSEQQRIAELLRQAGIEEAQSLQPIQSQSQMIQSGPFSYYAPDAGYGLKSLAQGIRGYTAKQKRAQAIEASDALGKSYQSDLAKALSDAQTASTGTPAFENPGSELSPGWTTPEVKPDRSAMINALMGHPATQALGMGQMQQDMQRNAFMAAGNVPRGTQSPPAQQVTPGQAPQGMPGQSPQSMPGFGGPAGGMPMSLWMQTDPSGKAYLTQLAKDHADNGPTPFMREMAAAGVGPGTPKYAEQVKDRSGRIAAEQTKLVDFTVPGTDTKVSLPNNIAQALITQQAPDEQTAAVATRIAGSLGMQVRIGVGDALGGLTGGAQQPMPLGESEKAGIKEAAIGSYKHIPQELTDSLAGAQNAVKRAQTIHNIDAALRSGKVITGPGATALTWFQRVGELAFGPGVKKSAADTQQLVQGLADLALSGAAAMRGQGTITENERLLLAKAKAGVQTLLPTELNALMTIFDKQNRYEIDSHNSKYDRAAKIKYPNLEYWGKVEMPPALGEQAAPKVNLSPAVIEFMRNNDIPIPGG